MKKQILTFCSVMLTLGLCAETPGAPVAAWGNLIDGGTAAGDQATDIALDGSGDVYWFGTYGTNASFPEIKYAGTLLYEGALLESGTTQNNNFTLLKTNAAGEKLWCVYSNSGDFANNNGFCASTPDGGVVTISKVRHTEGMLDTPITLVQADGTPYEFEWSVDRRHYYMMVTKFSGEGTLLWNRVITFSTEPGPAASGNNADFWADVFTPGTGAVDSEGNIYIPLNYRNPMTVTRADNSSVTLTPANTASWNGDTQTVAGDFLILSLDSEGYYRDNLQLTGMCSASYCQKLVCQGERLYAQGYIVGSGDNVLKAGDATLAPSNIMSPVLLCMDTDLNVVWGKCYKGEQVAGKNAIQNCGITVAGDALYMCGQYNLKFSDPDDPSKFVASTQGAIREGFLLKVDATDGKWLAARDSRDDEWDNPSAIAKTGLTGYLKPIVNTAVPETVYVYGYVMNANVGVFLRGYNTETLTGDLEQQYNIITGGGVPSAICAIFETGNSALYVNARGNKAFTLLDGETTDAPSGWGILAARFNLPSRATDIDGLPAISLSDSRVEYYTLQGIRVTNPTGGLYLRRQGTTVTKILLN